jgi:hypothetical protein
MGNIVSVRPIVQETVQNSAPSMFDGIIGLLPIIIIIILMIIGILFFFKWMVNKKIESKNIFLKEYKKVVKLCKINRDEKYLKPVFGIPSFLMKKGVDILITYPRIKPVDIDSDGKIVKQDSINFNVLPAETRKIGSYKGQCITSDGCLNLLISNNKDKFLNIFPRSLIIKVRIGVEKSVVKQKDKKGNNVEKIDVFPDIFTMSNEMILLTAFSLEKREEYYYLVNVDEYGRVVDSRYYSNIDLSEIAMQTQFTDLARNMVVASDELVRMNPLVQWAKKVEQQDNMGNG